MSPNDLLKQIRAEIRGAADIIPPGWKTSKQWAKDWSLESSTARKICIRGVKCGLLELKAFRVAVARCNIKVDHFRQKKKQG